MTCATGCPNSATHGNYCYPHSLTQHAPLISHELEPQGEKAIRIDAVEQYTSWLTAFGSENYMQYHHDEIAILEVGGVVRN
jgi:hypothetical protein